MMGMEPLGLSEFDSLTRKELTAMIARQAAQIEMMRSTLHVIVDADWRKWEELASPEEFVRRAKSRANHVLSTTPDQALDQFAAKVRKQCADLCYARSKRLKDGYWTDDEWDTICGANKLAGDAILEINDLP